MDIHPLTDNTYVHTHRRAHCFCFIRILLSRSACFCSLAISINWIWRNFFRFVFNVSSFRTFSSYLVFPCLILRAAFAAFSELQTFIFKNSCLRDSRRGKRRRKGAGTIVFYSSDSLLYVRQLSHLRLGFTWLISLVLVHSTSSPVPLGGLPSLTLCTPVWNGRRHACNNT